MKHLLAAWPAISKRIEEAGRILVLADYDGTLTPIVERPELAQLPAEVRRLLCELAHKSKVIVGLVSGRPLENLRGKVGISGIAYVGNHGLEIQGPGLNFVHPVAREVRPLLRRLHLTLTKTFEPIDGVMVEDKGLSLTVHYRLANQDRVRDIETILGEAILRAQAQRKVIIVSGKKVYEVRPAIDWDKGQAVKLLMETYAQTQAGIVIYLGDDLTDEDAFRVIRQYDYGISAFVGEPVLASQADYFLRSPSEVTTFLAMILEQAV